MNLHASLVRSLRRAFGLAGVDVRDITPVSGGDICASYRVRARFDGGEQTCFAKTLEGRYAAPLPGFFEAESSGLDALRRAAQGTSIRVPEVIVADEYWLVLEWIDRGAPSERSHRLLGEGLAQIHASECSQADFGASASGYIGTLPQANEPSEDWAAFYLGRRLEPLIERASTLLGPSRRERYEELRPQLGRWLRVEVRPSRVHGDLWSGNAFFDRHGNPVLIDPASYRGVPGVDLAMMQLFGGFSSQVFEAYEGSGGALLKPFEAALYQLYPALVHIHLFGGSYLSMWDQRIDKLREFAS